MSNKLINFERNPPIWSDSESDSSSSESSSERKTSSKHSKGLEKKISIPLTSWDNSIQNVTVISFIMGNLFTLNLIFLFHHHFDHPYYKLHLYLLILIVVTVNSFLLNNGIEYWLAHLFALTEYILIQTYFPKPNSMILNSISLIIILISQSIRTLSMITAAQSFNHKVSTSKVPEEDHKLITNGIYQFIRHPSYFGFFYWSISLQLFLKNWCSFLLFALILWNFFHKRIQNEELHLIKFFGKDYLDYKSRTGIYIPFIR
ncbi:Isoprenylcysteine carboxyl methyltransferase family-domain-containing protein [Melampsora americana]|nr:Isoprenylcysteine carboxyl methyltransferase family-domain-containing protein [Melampsora americana]